MIKTERFQYVVFNPRTRLNAAEYYLHASYSLWNEVWSQALEELEGVSTVASDDFTRHDEIHAVFDGDRAVGSISFSTVDLSKVMWKRDSYFKVWPADVLERLAKVYPGRAVNLGCYFTLAPEWRRDAGGFSMKRLMMALAVEQFLHSRSQGMVGTMRVNRGMHTICYELGAEPLAKNVEQHGVGVDLLIYDRRRIEEEFLNAPYMPEAREIYKRVLNFESAPLLEKRAA